MNKRFVVGDRVIYRKQKRSSAPGPRAKNVLPASQGEEYGYSVDKYWRVVALHENGDIDVITRRRKRHRISAGDECLRLAHWWETFFFADRFPPLDAQEIPDDDGPTSGT